MCPRVLTAHTAEPSSMFIILRVVIPQRDLIEFEYNGIEIRNRS